MADEVVRKAADRRVEESEEAYYMVGPFGRVGRGLLWCGLSTLVLTGVGSLWALWSIAANLSVIEQVLRRR